MNIAIAGTRGIPANYGGFETFAEELSTRLVARGHDVTVYGRANNIQSREPVYQGVRLVILPTIPTKHLDTVAHTALSLVHSLGCGYDVMLICNAANAIFSVLPRLIGVPVALNVDGIERKRKKWGLAGRAYYRLSERLATIFPSVIVTDARVIQTYFREALGVESVMIAYGATCGRRTSSEFIESLGLKSRGYLLYVSRLEPENNAHQVIEAYREVPTSLPLVIVGDAPYAGRYIRQLQAQADDRVRLTGAIYGDRYLELRSHAYAWIQATEVGGTHPALLEAMASGNCVLARDTLEHREVLGSAGLYFRSVSELRDEMAALLKDPIRAASFRAASAERVQGLYSWDRITDEYESLFEALVTGGSPVGSPG
jgi:glycosyltransferase involved in cell wall biosynthesis